MYKYVSILCFNTSHILDLFHGRDDDDHNEIPF